MMLYEYKVLKPYELFEGFDTIVLTGFISVNYFTDACIRRVFLKNINDIETHMCTELSITDDEYDKLVNDGYIIETGVKRDTMMVDTCSLYELIEFTNDIHGGDIEKMKSIKILYGAYPDLHLNPIYEISKDANIKDVLYLFGG